MSKLSGPSRAQARLQNRLLRRVRRHGNLTALYGRGENGQRHPTAPVLPTPLPNVPLVRATLVAGHPYQSAAEHDVEVPVLVVEVPEVAAPPPEAVEPAVDTPPHSAPEAEQAAGEQEPVVMPDGDHGADATAEAAAPPPGSSDEGVLPPAGDSSSVENSWRRLQKVWRKQEEKRASGVPPKVELEAPWLRRLFE